MLLLKKILCLTYFELPDVNKSILVGKGGKVGLRKDSSMNGFVTYYSFMILGSMSFQKSPLLFIKIGSE